MITCESIIEILNDMIEVDRPAMQKMIATRFEFAPALGPHPTIQVWDTDGKIEVTLLGVVNGIVGNEGRIASEYDDDGRLVRFRSLDEKEIAKVDCVLVE